MSGEPTTELDFATVMWCTGTSGCEEKSIACDTCIETNGTNSSEYYECYGPVDCTDFDDGGCRDKLRVGFIIFFGVLVVLVVVVLCCFCACCWGCYKCTHKQEVDPNKGRYSAASQTSGVVEQELTGLKV